jgi:hypothetical protein
MVNGTDRATPNGIDATETAIVAKSLNDLPVRQRQKITTELARIHKIVSSHDEDKRDSSRDKAGKPA